MKLDRAEPEYGYPVISDFCRMNIFNRFTPARFPDFKGDKGIAFCITDMGLLLLWENI
jgi:hypothetical protein